MVNHCSTSQVLTQLPTATGDRGTRHSAKAHGEIGAMAMCASSRRASSMLKALAKNMSMPAPSVVKMDALILIVN